MNIKSQKTYVFYSAIFTHKKVIKREDLEQINN